VELDAEIAAAVRESFERQTFMATLGATLERVAYGTVEIALTPSQLLAQQHGYVHAGALVSILDSACGYAALTTMPVGSEVLSAELKVNLLAPARGDRVVATGVVVHGGRTLTVCRGDAHARGVHVATMLATMIRRDAGRGGAARDASAID
jgi:uncharacterized protein (TIGR00369 family)